jgi:small-conductance mechanosensitive channel
MAGLIDAIDRHTGVGKPLSTIFVVFALFLVAWLVSLLASRIAAAYVDRTERRRAASAGEADTGVITGIRQRETATSLIATTIRYAAYALALALALVALSGGHRLQTVLGASFLAIIVGFAAQRFLTDVIAGLLMFFEGWFRIGDTVAIDPWNAQGVVEAVSLRALTIRTITGEILHVPNSQVVTLRVFPRGYHEVELELFTSALVPGRALVEEVARIVPAGPTRFVRRPAVGDTEQLDDDLYRITARCAVSVGREWLAQDLLPSLIKERAEEGLLVHGPIVTFIDEQARLTFERALGAAGTGAPTRRRKRLFGAARR